MEMHWESLLEELWSYAASDPVELETKIRSSLKGHSSEGLLQAISLLVAQEQHAIARTLLSEFLRNHQAADDIQQRLALILQFKKHRAPQMLSIKSKQRSRELLLKDVNELVASGKLQAAESLLLEAINTFEEADYLNLLSRVYMLQRLPIDGAKAIQRALLLRRQQQAFVEISPDESTDDLPTDSDLAFLNDSAERLATLECSTALAEVQQHEFNDSLKEEILDQLTELIDVEEILQQATKLGIDRTRERIDEALKQARTAAAKQRELFVHAATCDPNELRDELEITVEHLYSFVLGMFEQLGIEVAERSHKERLLRIRSSEQVMRDMGLSPKASPRMDVTLDRMLAANRPDTHMLDLISKLMQYLLGKACEHDFGSLVAMLKAPELGEGALLGAMLRWQGPQDNRMRQEFVAIPVNAGKTKLNSVKASQWLLTPAEHSTLTPDTEASKLLFKASEEMANQRLADASNRYLIPENLDWAAAGWTQQH